jgi:phage replication O-like protein O
MANPQKENGHLDIANELVEHLAKINLSSYEWRFLWALWRRTWAWHKKEDCLPVSQIAEMTGMCKSHVSRAKKMLTSMKIVTDGGNGHLKFNKNYDQWTELPKGARSHRVTNGGYGVTPIGNKSLPPSADSKEKKETLSKETTPPLSPPRGNTRLQDLLLHIQTFGVSTEEFWPIWDEWVKGKIGKKWKNVSSERKAITHLMNLCGRDLTLARKIVDQSLAAPWQGLFPLKDTGNENDTFMSARTKQNIKAGQEFLRLQQEERDAKARRS